MSHTKKTYPKEPNGYQVLFGLSLMAIGVFNFILYLSLWPDIGGTAWHGKIEDGQYFLGHHGVYTEVTEKTWWYSDLHGKSVFVTNFAGLVGLTVFFFGVVKYQHTEEEI